MVTRVNDNKNKNSQNFFFFFLIEMDKCKISYCHWFKLQITSCNIKINSKFFKKKKKKKKNSKIHEIC
jgi:hypothetical protein